MDFSAARKFRVSSRSTAIIVPLATLLLASAFWNLRQHRLIEQDRGAAQQKEAARIKEEAERADALKKKNAEWAASDARVQQLYREINNLSHINERLLAEPMRTTPMKVDRLEETDGSLGRP